MKKRIQRIVVVVGDAAVASASQLWVAMLLAVDSNIWASHLWGTTPVPGSSVKGASERLTTSD